MASKQLGRLRQWAGEVISSKEKVAVSEEFQDLEKDIELRKEGMQRLLSASEVYHHALSKKKGSDDHEEKLLPIDSLGIVMIVHGEEFGAESPFGHSLVKLGRAHCKVATLQEAYALTFKDTFITSINRFKEEIKEYELLRKNLYTRRSNYDAACTKFDKLQNTGSKKEKDRREAEEEMDRAKQRYEETAEDLRAHMHAIQEDEFSQLRELTSFLELETNFVQSYLDVLKDVRAEWQQPANGHRSRRSSQTLHNARPLAKSSSLRSNGRIPAAYPDSSGSSEDEALSTRSISKHSKNGSTSSRTPSRPASRLSRKRTDSTAASGSIPDDKEKEGTERSRRLSVAGWASNAVESVTGSKSKKKKDKDKDSFATLDDDAGDKADNEQTSNGNAGTLKQSSSFKGISPGRSQRKKSKENIPTTSPKVPPRILKPPSMQGPKVVRALYDFSGSSDELTFKAGTEIVVVNEVLDDWWLGEVDGRQGLFPTSYIEVVTSRSTPNLNDFTLKVPDSPPPSGRGTDRDEYVTSDDDRDFRAEPMALTSPFYGGFNDVASITDSAAEDEDESKTQPLLIPTKQALLEDKHWYSVPDPLPAPVKSRRRSTLNPLDPAQQPLINRSQSENTLPNMTPMRKAPPPPPPRRPMSHNPSPGPPIPERKISVFLGAPSTSSQSAPGVKLTPSSSWSSEGHGFDRSPFDSAAELEGIPHTTTSRQNPFKP